MPKLSQVISVQVVDAGEVGLKRKLTLEIEAVSDLFTLSDMLAREGAVKDIENHLKRAGRRALIEYIGSGREFLKGMGKKQKNETESKND
jgi:hypothetical protein